ncbi:LacI family DNA-binding transcriptional regulator [Corynebacterium crudilactis]|uniref:LacI family transcriptional regulator n=1 Tax=Corynebacterium crudilactis TaxID=1652495 RepID=A0A172QQG1_9CORY|nr:LacI family DNA-binding transcriptional regulator [Corynebacterium crudilactis]ANE02927.1 LacI family transcriptional regulator [Corynebacterium crudilactis]
MNVKLTDVAREAGVGYGTASRAISGRGSVDAATRNKVLAAAEKLGYRTNSMARALRENKTRTVGLIVPDIINEFYTESAAVLQDELDKSGYQLVVSTIGNDPEKERRAIESMLNRQVDAVVHVPVNPQAEFPKGFKVVELNRRSDVNRPTVTSDDAAGLKELAIHILNQGYRDIGIIIGPAELSTSRDRKTGFVSALESEATQRGVREELRYRVVHSRYSPTGGYDAFTVFTEDLPEIVVPLSTQLTLGVLKATQKRSIQIPNDLALACYGVAEWLAVWGPGITVFSPDLPAMGAAAATQVLTLLDAEPLPENHLKIPGQLIVRGTTPKI